MNNWIKIEGEIFISISNEHQFTIDNQWTTSYFLFDVKSNVNYLPKFLNYYENKISFNWEDNKSRGIGSSIKSFDIYNDVVTLTVRSPERSKDVPVATPIFGVTSVGDDNGALASS